MKEKSFSKKLYHAFDKTACGSFCRFTGSSPAFLAVWGGQKEREAAFLDVKFHAARFRVCVGLLADRRAASVNSSRVFSFGFVTAGRPFLPANTGKGQSVTRPPPKVCELLVYAIA